MAGVQAINGVSAERDGALSHGVFRIPGYVSTLRSGWVDGRAVPAVTDDASAFVQVNANKGAVAIQRLQRQFPRLDDRIARGRADGGRFSSEVNWSLHPGAVTPCTSELMILIDPALNGTSGGVGLCRRHSQP